MGHIAILVCTEGRAAYLPWLAWNIRRQRLSDGIRPRVYMACSTTGELDVLRRLLPNHYVNWVPKTPDASVPAKRNALLEAARADFCDFFAWMDVDDWHHPDRLDLGLAQLQQGNDWVGFSMMPYVKLETLRWCEVVSQRFEPIPITLMGRVGGIGSVPFDLQHKKASDTHWARTVMRQPGAGMTVAVERKKGIPTPLFFAVKHGQNMSRHTDQFAYNRPLLELKALVGTSIWADTTQRLRELQRATGLDSPEDGG